MTTFPSPRDRGLLLTLQVPAFFAAVVLVGANAFVLTPILSEVAASLGGETYEVAASISTFGAATAVSAFLLAPLVDRVQARHALGGAALLLALAQAASGLSQSWQALCVAQALAGIAVGVLLPGTYATASATAPPGREAARLGIVLTGWALSFVLAVPLAALIAERAGWRMVYVLLAAISALTAAGLAIVLRGVRIGAARRSSPWTALRLPGVLPLLVVNFGYMTAFYGSFAYFGEGIRAAFDFSADGAGLFVLAYGLGFGIAGIVLGRVAPAITRGYLVAVLLVLAGVYLLWRPALAEPVAAFAAAMAWGAINQLGLSALVVSLNRRAGDSRGAVMGLNSAVTYSAVFAGPMLMGQIYARTGFAGITTLSAAIVVASAGLAWRMTR